MAQLRLLGEDIQQLQGILLAAFTRPRFDDLLLYRLNRHTDEFVGTGDDYRTTLRKVLVEANAQLWLRKLVVEARNAMPSDPDLIAFADGLELAPTTVAADKLARKVVHGTELELRIKAAQSTYDIAHWRTAMGQIEGRVCRIEYPPETAHGTGFIVGPGLVLTNYHVIEKVRAGEFTPENVVLRFDFKRADTGVAVQEGVKHKLAAEWLEDYSEYSPRDFEAAPAQDPRPDQLDYALLRTRTDPGIEPVGGPTQDSNTTMRGYMAMPTTPYEFAFQSALYIVQHPDGKPMQVALDTEAVLGENENGTRVRYTTTTEPGSSGSPCFGPDWQWVALHHAGDPKYLVGQAAEFNQGIPVSAIHALLEQRGKLNLLGG